MPGLQRRALVPTFLDGIYNTVKEILHFLTVKQIPSLILQKKKKILTFPPNYFHFARPHWFSSSIASRLSLFPPPKKSTKIIQNQQKSGDLIGPLHPRPREPPPSPPGNPKTEVMVFFVIIDFRVHFRSF